LENDNGIQSKNQELFSQHEYNNGAESEGRRFIGQLIGLNQTFSASPH